MGENRMKPTNFKEANKTYTRPSSMTPDECEDLRTFSNEEVIISLWTTSLRERLSILLFGRIWLTILGNVHPPVSLVGERNRFEESTDD